MEEQKKKISRSLIVIGIFVVILVFFYIYVHISTTPEEEAYAAAVQRVVELSDEQYNKARQENENESYVEKAKKYMEKMAREKEEEAQPYFDKYRKEYVSKEGDGYLVELPVQEMLDYKVVQEYTYEIYVEERAGEFVVVSMERKGLK